MIVRPTSIGGRKWKTGQSGQKRKFFRRLVNKRTHRLPTCAISKSNAGSICSEKIFSTLRSMLWRRKRPLQLRPRDNRPLCYIGRSACSHCTALAQADDLHPPRREASRLTASHRIAPHKTIRPRFPEARPIRRATCIRPRFHQVPYCNGASRCQTAMRGSCGVDKQL